MRLYFLPNVITLLRCCIAVVIFICAFFSLCAPVWYVLMFSFGYLTDALDGLLARWLHASSIWGAFLDLLADKMLFFAVWFYIASVCTDPLLYYCVLMLCCRELLSIFLREWASMLGISIVVQSHGKIKTIYLGILVIYTLCQNYHNPSALMLLLWAAGVLISWMSFAVYCGHFLEACGVKRRATCKASLR